MNKQSAIRVIERFPSLRIVVAGDFMLDEYVWGRVDRISPEAPVPVVNVERETLSPGGAGNVVMNARSLGASVVPVGLVGKDSAGTRIRELFAQHQIEDRSLLTTTRPTTTKSRIIAHQQQVVRVDREEQGLVDDNQANLMAREFVKRIVDADGIIISDYAKGSVSPAFLSRVLPKSKELAKIVCLDPKIRYFSCYTPVTVITPNQNEASSLLGYPIETDDDLKEAGRRIFELIDCKALLITRGAKGMALFENGQMTVVPTRAREVYDVTGAGDTVVTVLCMALAAGADMLTAVELSNLAAGIVVSKVGTAVVKTDELLAAIG